MTLTSLTPTPAEDAEIEALRTGLDGLPAGPWRHYRDRLRPNFGGIVNEVQCRSKTPVVAWPGFDDSNRSEPKRALIAAHIARCSPDAIRRVLARLDASKSELATLRARLAEAERERDEARQREAGLRANLDRIASYAHWIDCAVKRGSIPPPDDDCADTKIQETPDEPR